MLPLAARVLDRLSLASLHYPRALTAAAALAGFVALAVLVDPSTLRPRIAVDPSMDALLPQSGSAREDWQRAQALFRDDDLLLVAWLGSDLFSVERLAAAKRLTRRLEAQPDVVRVDSIANALDIEVGNDVTRVRPFLHDIPVTEHAGDEDDVGARIRQRITANPLYAGRLVNGDGTGLLFVLHFTPGLDTATLRERVAMVERESATAGRGVEQFVSGPLAVRLAVSAALEHDLLYVTPLAALATLVVTALGFRSLHGVVLPLLSNAIVTLGTLALFVATGQRPDFVTVMLAPVVFVIGFAYTVHVVSEFDRRRETDGARRSAVTAACRSVAVPLALTALTTVVAFIALSITPIASIRLFGLYTAIGVALAWLMAMFVVPAALLLVPLRALPPPAWLRSPPPGLLPVLDRSWRRVLVAGALLAVIATMLFARIEVDTAVLRNFDDGSEIRRNFERAATQFAGPVPLRVLVSAERADAFRDPANLAAIDALANWLRQQPEIGGVYSLADYVAVLHRALMPELARESRLPATPRTTAHVLLGAGGPDLRRFVDAAFRTTLIDINATTLSTATVNALARRIETRLRALPQNLNGSVTGTTRATAGVVEALTRGQLQSLALAFGAVYLVLALAFRSPLLSLLALVPNALPVLCYFALLGLLPISLNLATSLVACAVFGIAVDDTVHFLARLRMETRTGADPLTATRRTLEAVWRPVTLTTLSLAAGFFALTGATLGSQAEFGLLAAATLILAWVVDVTFTPALALCSRLARETRPAAD